MSVWLSKSTLQRITKKPSTSILITGFSEFISIQERTCRIDLPLIQKKEGIKGKLNENECEYAVINLKKVFNTDVENIFDLIRDPLSHPPTYKGFLNIK